LLHRTSQTITFCAKTAQKLPVRSAGEQGVGMTPPVNLNRKIPYLFFSKYQ